MGQLMQELDVGKFLKLDQAAIAALHLFPVHSPQPLVHPGIAYIRIERHAGR